MWGPDDPSNRKPMLWKDLGPYEGGRRTAWTTSTSPTTAASVSCAGPLALRRSTFETLVCDDAQDLFVFRGDATERAGGPNAGTPPPAWSCPRGAGRRCTAATGAVDGPACPRSTVWSGSGKEPPSEAPSPARGASPWPVAGPPASVTSAPRPTTSWTGAPPPASPGGRCCRSARSAPATRPTARPAPSPAAPVLPRPAGPGGLLADADLEAPAALGSGRIDYRRAAAFKRARLARAFEAWGSRAPRDRRFERFCAEASGWLDPWAERASDPLEYASCSTASRCSGATCAATRAGAASGSSRTLIFVGLDSVDVQAHPGLFRLDRAGLPKVVTGCPPDRSPPTASAGVTPTTPGEPTERGTSGGGAHRPTAGPVRRRPHRSLHRVPPRLRDPGRQRPCPRGPLGRTPERELLEALRTITSPAPAGRGPRQRDPWSGGAARCLRPAGDEDPPVGLPSRLGRHPTASPRTPRSIRGPTTTTGSRMVARPRHAARARAGHDRGGRGASRGTCGAPRACGRPHRHRPAPGPPRAPGQHHTNVPGKARGNWRCDPTPARSTPASRPGPATCSTPLTDFSLLSPPRSR